MTPLQTYLETTDKEFEEKFKNIYYGKDENGHPQYMSYGYNEVKDFLQSRQLGLVKLLEKRRNKMKKIIKIKKEK